MIYLLMTQIGASYQKYVDDIFCGMYSVNVKLYVHAR